MGIVWGYSHQTHSLRAGDYQHVSAMMLCPLNLKYFRCHADHCTWKSEIWVLLKFRNERKSISNQNSKFLKDFLFVHFFFGLYFFIPCLHIAKLSEVCPAVMFKKKKSLLILIFHDSFKKNVSPDSG